MLTYNERTTRITVTNRHTVKVGRQIEMVISIFVPAESITHAAKLIS